MSERIVRVVAAVIESGGTYLVTQRRPNAVLPDLWEFPGGRVEAGETDQDALAREIRERLDADVRVLQMISFVRHPYESYTVDLHLYQCELLSEVRAAAVQDFRWIRSDDFERYDFTPADEASMSQLLGES
ncbi:MAG: (deoxy)nucleoside triphosphate pyrophosphohydrolase [Myxococcales bacterium]|jgi:8-oxo-dGTP diphosphatase